MTVKVRGQWKKDTREYNGLDVEPTRKSLIEEPLTRRYGVVLLETAKVETLVQEGGVQVPTVNIVAIEIADGDDAVTLKALLDKLFADRTGRKVDPTLFDGDDPEAMERALDGNIEPADPPKRGRRS